ncbi:MAG: 50S ribosomal protein L5 [Bdellovibrionales bacterium]
MSLLYDKYKKDVVPQLMKQLGFSNIHQIPKISKVVLSVCSAEVVKNPKMANTIADELTAISGQKAVITKAKKAISNFKLRQGIPLGATVTLRNEKAWVFLEKLIHFGLPRVRDFRGLPSRGFDGRGNYNMGLKEQIIFPEVEIEKVDLVRGMNITVCTSGKTDEEGRALLEALGMPFRK